jgi:hypothetical protein
MMAHKREDHDLDLRIRIEAGWIERRLRSFLAKKWRNTVWRRYLLPRLVQEFGLCG